jgi:hypothetical protein
VDASSIYNKGWDDVTIPDDNITTNGPEEYVGGTDHIINIYVKATASNGKVGNKTLKVSATSVYNLGINKGANSLSINPNTDTELDYDGSVTVTATTTNALGEANNKSITITAPSNNYNSGWNNCIDTAYNSGTTALVLFNTVSSQLYYANGQPFEGGTLYYGGAKQTRYLLPAKK